MNALAGDPRFRLSDSGRFYVREGAAGRGAPQSMQKLCVAATDLKCLADLLYGLSLRADCLSVKYSAFTRDGMVLGRCYLQTDEAAAALCQALKAHPRFLVALQDDAFFNRYRDQPWAPGNVGIWDDWPEDWDAVGQIEREAFGRPDEAALVERVRASGELIISLVAGVGRELFGHVLLSPVTLAGLETPRGLGLGPVAVRPSHQKRGIGSALIRAGLERARLLGYDYAVVLGHPGYYPRFGFVPASRFGLSFGASVPDDVFMALELRTGALSAVAKDADARGPVVVRYLPAFG